MVNLEITEYQLGQVKRALKKRLGYLKTGITLPWKRPHEIDELMDKIIAIQAVLREIEAIEQV